MKRNIELPSIKFKCPKCNHIVDSSNWEYSISLSFCGFMIKDKCPKCLIDLFDKSIPTMEEL